MQAVPVIPDPVLRSVRNETGYALFQCDKMGPGRKFHDTLVVKAAFALTDGVLEPLDVRAPIHLSDTYWGPGPAARSSIRDPGDALFHKPGTDVIVTGTARAPGRLALRLWEVAVVVRSATSTLLRHEVVASGPRRWEHKGTLRGWRLGDPEPVTELPIRYELAYGGAYHDPRKAPDARGSNDEAAAEVVHADNPCGVAR